MPVEQHPDGVAVSVEQTLDPGRELTPQHAHVLPDGHRQELLDDVFPDALRVQRRRQLHVRERHDLDHGGEFPRRRQERAEGVLGHSVVNQLTAEQLPHREPKLATGDQRLVKSGAEVVNDVLDHAEHAATERGADGHVHPQRGLRVDVRVMEYLHVGEPRIDAVRGRRKQVAQRRPRPVVDAPRHWRPPQLRQHMSHLGADRLLRRTMPLVEQSLPGRHDDLGDRQVPDIAIVVAVTAIVAVTGVAERSLLIDAKAPQTHHDPDQPVAAGQQLRSRRRPGAIGHGQHDIVRLDLSAQRAEVMPHRRVQQRRGLMTRLRPGP
jgi:hypothetical protein